MAESEGTDQVQSRSRGEAERQDSADGSEPGSGRKAAVRAQGTGGKGMPSLTLLAPALPLRQAIGQHGPHRISNFGELHQKIVSERATNATVMQLKNLIVFNA